MLGVDKALSLAYHFLKFRSRTVWEMKCYLQKKSVQWNLSQKDIDTTITYLIEMKLLDDSQFVGEYVRSRNTIKPKSEFVLRLELRKLGIADDILNEHFQTHHQNEEKLANEALKQKVKVLRLIPDRRKRFQKAVQFLQRRGFSYEVAKKAVITTLTTSN